MNKGELRATISLASVFAARLLGLFMIYPIFAHYAQGLSGADPRMIGLALGAYGLAQGILQIPLGLLSDRIGRKVVIAGGLLVFGVGSVVAAVSTSIDGVLLGRILQGAGAVGSSILALVADLTRDEVRTRAMAVVGITIGFSFALAVLVGPPIAAVVGLSGVFWITAVLAVAGIAVTLGVVPTPDHIVQRDLSSSTFSRVLGDPELLRLDYAIFTLHAVLTACFLVIPAILLHSLRLNVADQWMFYLPVMVVAMGLMVPAIIVAETRGKMKEVFVISILVIIASLAALAMEPGSEIAVIIALTAFFTGFNAMEAMLPSLVTKFAPVHAKGAATGVYSSSQFIGIFVGGAGGGWMLAEKGASGVFGFAIVLTLIWLALAATMRRPVSRRSRSDAGEAHPEKA